MNAEVFWAVIGRYNESTWVFQILLLLLLGAGLWGSYVGKTPWMAKMVLGVANLFIAAVFFGVFGTQPIQKLFALPLYLGCGILFLYESVQHRSDPLQLPQKLQSGLMLLFILYPLISFLLGNRFPRMVTYVMPCPIASLSIVVYAGYQRKNRLLLLLLSLWGLTGVKSVFVYAWEDLILLICGVYCTYLFIMECRRVSRNKKIIAGETADTGRRGDT